MRWRRRRAQRGATDKAVNHAGWSTCPVAGRADLTGAAWPSGVGRVEGHFRSQLYPPNRYSERAQRTSTVVCFSMSV
jgi:hypothetical protein